jgi:hypothetical protein
MKQFLQWMKLKEKSYAEFHDTEKSWTPRNSTNSVIWNSAEFMAIPHSLRNIRNLKKHTEFRIRGIPKTPYPPPGARGWAAGTYWSQAQGDM